MIELILTPLLDNSYRLRNIDEYFALRINWKDEKSSKNRLHLSVVAVVLQCTPVGGRAKNQHYFDHGR